MNRYQGDLLTFLAKATWLQYGILAGSMVFAFSNIPNLDFWDGWDDREFIQVTHRGVEDFGFIFSAEKDLPVRPVRDLLFLGIYYIWPDNPIPFRIAQIFLHILSCLLFGQTCRKFGADRNLSFAAMLLFSVNVAHFRIVHWITCINYILAFIFSLLALLAFAKYIKTARGIWITLSILNLGLAIFSHPSAVSIALFFLYLSSQFSFYRAIRLSSPLLISAAIFGALAFLVSPNTIQTSGLLVHPEPERLIQNFFWYLGRLLSSSFWLTQTTASSHRNAWEQILGSCYVLAVFILYRRRLFPAAHWGVFSILTVLPFVNTQLWRLAFGPSRQLYFASSGFSLVFAWALRKAIYHIKANTISIRGRNWIWCFALMTVVGASIWHLKKAEALSIYFGGRGYAFRVNQQPENAQRAVRLYEQAIRHAPHLHPPEVYQRLTSMSFTLGESHIDLLNAAAKRFPNDPTITMLQGVAAFIDTDEAHHRMGEDQILQAFSQAQDKGDLRAKTALAFHNLAIYFYDTRQYRRAIDLYQKAIKFNPGHITAYYNLGLAFDAVGQTTQAIDAYQQAIAKKPHYLDAMQNLANTWSENGNYQQAIDMYREILAIDSTNAANYYNLGIALVSIKEYQDAEKAFSQVVLLNPLDTVAWRKLAEMRLAQNKNKAALDAYQTLIKLQPDDAAVRYNAGILMLQNNRPHEAVRILHQAQQLAPKDIDINLALALAFTRSEQRDAALSAYRRVLQLDPENDTAKTQLQALMDSQ